MKKNLNVYYQDSKVVLDAIQNAMTLAPEVKPAGYARKKGAQYAGDRVVTLMLSDTHYGTDLTATDHLRPYSNVEECRATAKVIANLLDYKTDHRDKTTVHLWIGGDLFAGLLGHDDRSLPELQVQMLRAASVLVQGVSLVAAEFPKLIVTVDWGNHGRDTLRHKSRADNYKWLNWELITMFLVRTQCQKLRNVSWHLHRRAYGFTKLFGWQFFTTHGDTILSKKPGSQGFARQLASINSSPYYQGRNHVALLGHWHSGETFQVDHTRVFVNGALIPPDGFSESHGFLAGAGQWIFETTEKHAVGDTRFVEVTPKDYLDTGFDGLIEPWSEELVFSEASPAA
jgi:hypothetical protein